MSLTNTRHLTDEEFYKMDNRKLPEGSLRHPDSRTLSLEESKRISKELKEEYKLKDELRKKEKAEKEKEKEKEKAKEKAKKLKEKEAKKKAKKDDSSSSDSDSDSDSDDDKKKKHKAKGKGVRPKEHREIMEFLSKF